MVLKGVELILWPIFNMTCAIEEVDGVWCSLHDMICEIMSPQIFCCMLTTPGNCSREIWCSAGRYTSGSSWPGSCNRSVHRSLFTMRVGTCRCKFKTNFSWKSRRHWHSYCSSRRPHRHEGLLVCSGPLLTGIEFQPIVECGSWKLKHWIFNLQFPFLPIASNP